MHWEWERRKPRTTVEEMARSGGKLAFEKRCWRPSPTLILKGGITFYCTISSPTASGFNFLWAKSHNHFSRPGNMTLKGLPLFSQQLAMVAEWESKVIDIHQMMNQMETVHRYQKTTKMERVSVLLSNLMVWCGSVCHKQYPRLHTRRHKE